MGLKHSIPLVAFLMSLALIGWPIIEFIFVAIVAMGIGAVLFYTFLGFTYILDIVFDYFCTAK